MLKPVIKVKIISGTYGSAASLPTVLAGKCEGSTCSALTTINADILTIKKCFDNPSASDCTGKISFII